MFARIKNYFLQKHLKAKKPEIIRELCALERANTIGVLCEITDEDSYKAIFKIFTQLQQNNKIVHLIGYIDEKYVPFYCLQQLSADYFCQNSSPGAVSPIWFRCKTSLPVILTFS